MAKDLFTLVNEFLDSYLAKNLFSSINPHPSVEHGIMPIPVSSRQNQFSLENPHPTTEHGNDFLTPENSTLEKNIFSPSSPHSTTSDHGNDFQVPEIKIPNEFSLEKPHPTTEHGTMPTPDKDDPFTSRVVPNSFATPIEGKINSPAYHQGNQYDDGSFKFAGRGGPFELFSSYTGPLRFFDIGATAHWMRAIGREVLFIPKRDPSPTNPDKQVGLTTETIAKSTTWLASQFLLASLNPGDPAGHGIGNMIWNPLSLPLSAIPGMRNFSPTRVTLGNAAELTYTRNVAVSVEPGADVGAERLLQMRNGFYSEVSPIERMNQGRSPIAPPGFRGDVTGHELQTIDQQKAVRPDKISTIQYQVDGAGGLDEAAKKLDMHTNIYNAGRPYNNSTAVMPIETLESRNSTNPELDKLSALFSKGPFDKISVKQKMMGKSWVAKTSLKHETGIKSIDIPKDVSARIHLVETENGIVKEKDVETIEEEMYMPFSFQDLRNPDDFLYFRAFLKSGLNELFTPNWQNERFYGRVDEVMVYQGTSRNINVAFDVVSWNPDDLQVMWKKLKKLQSMVYPKFSEDGHLHSGPVVRMRIGDLFAQANSETGKSVRGIPGVITSMDWSYDDGIFNIKVGNKVPRKVSISLGFTVLHDGQPGLSPQNEFGAIKFDEKEKKIVESSVDPSIIRKIFSKNKV